MSDRLYPYYERELLFIRQMAQEFAQRYPGAAGRLLLEPDRSVDPHVERLIESFALLAGRIQHKLDDEFPELTDALLSVLYPHFLAPIPSMGIIQFELDTARAQLPDGITLERHSRLHTQTLGNLACKFRTGYPVTLWPIQLTEVDYVLPPFPPGFAPPRYSAAALRMRFECVGGLTFSKLSMNQLRFHFSGERHLVATLYETLFNHTLQVVFRSADPGSPVDPVVLPPQECLAQVGFERDEGLLPYPSQSFLGYRLLTEFFAFPAKFHFMDLKGLSRACRPGFENKLEVLFFFNRGSVNLEQGITNSTFLLGCTPVINLFEQTAEPIALTQARHEYRVVPDVTAQDGMEVHSVLSVTGTDLNAGTSREYQPFYSIRHLANRADGQAFWYATREPSTQERDHSTDVNLCLVDQDFNPRVPAETTLVVRTLCTNRELPSRVRQAGDELRFELEAAAPLSRIRTIRSPASPQRAPLRRGGYWRLISHLNLNHLSLADSQEGRDALCEILRQYDFSDPETGKQRAAVNRQIVDGITAVRSRRVVGRLESEAGIGICRGIEVTIEFDEQQYVGTGVFLFASVLERFFGLYTSINSFSQLVAKLRQGETEFKKWPPRAGDQPLL